MVSLSMRTRRNIRESDFSCRKYLTEEKRDVQRAVSYFEPFADRNPWASYWLGKIYLFGCEEVPQNWEKALKYLTLSAEQGNEYAQSLIDHETEYKSAMLTNTIFSLMMQEKKTSA